MWAKSRRASARLWQPGSFLPSFKSIEIKRAKLYFFDCLTNTVDSSVIQVVPKGALAAERSVGVDADAVLADAWVVQTLIHVCREPEKVLEKQTYEGILRPAAKPHV